MVTPGRFELPACGLGNRRSIHLSYGATRRNGVAGLVYRKSRSGKEIAGAAVRILHNKHKSSELKLYSYFS